MKQWMFHVEGSLEQEYLKESINLINTKTLILTLFIKNNNWDQTGVRIRPDSVHTWESPDSQGHSYNNTSNKYNLSTTWSDWCLRRWGRVFFCGGFEIVCSPERCCSLYMTRDS